MHLPQALLLTALCLATPTVFALEDTATGLKVELSDDFRLERSPEPSPAYDVLIGVDTVSGDPPIVGTSDYLCGVAFIASSQNAEMTQAEINAVIDTPEWGDLARQSMAATMTFEQATTFQLAGITGTEFIAIPKNGPDHDNVRLVLSVLETPKGRTMVSCVATATTLKNALPVFRTIRDGITPPG